MKNLVPKPPLRSNSFPPAAWGKLALTPLDERDVDVLLVWQNSPELRDLTMGYRFPIQKESVREWLKTLRQDNGRTRIAYAIRNQSTLLGVIQLHSIDRYQRNALLALYIGDVHGRKRGGGWIATALLLDFAFNGLDFHKIGLEVRSDNLPAIRLYEKLGFVHEGLKRQEFFSDGRWHDVALFSILQKEFLVPIPESANRLIPSGNRGAEPPHR